MTVVIYNKMMPIHQQIFQEENRWKSFWSYKALNKRYGNAMLF